MRRPLTAALLLVLTACGSLQQPPGSAPVPGGLYSDTEVVASTLPVDGETDTWRTMLRDVIPVRAGDTLDVTAWAGVVNENSYVVGVGWHLWAYDVDSGLGSSGPWWRISPSQGDNVTFTRHHMPIMITTLYEVPATWPEGHRIVVALRADAHSTAWQPGDVLDVAQSYGSLTTRKWTQGTAPGV